MADERGYKSRSSGFTRPAGRRILRTVWAALVVCCGAALLATAAGGATTGSNSTLTYGGPGGCVALTPGGPASSGIYYDDYQLGIAYENLIEINGQGQLVPGLATAWKVLPGNKTMTLTLRKNARFSDGTPVDAQAVTTWLNYWASTSPARSLMPISSVTAASRWVVRITLKTPDPVWPRLLAGYSGTDPISPRAVAILKANPNDSVVSQQSFGAGPYVLDPSQTVLGDHCTYVPNRYYYDRSAIKWKKVVVRHVADPNALLAAMESGQVDVGTGAAATAAAAKRAGLTVDASPQTGSSADVFFFDKTGSTNPAIGNVLVRRALNYAVDRKTIVRALWPGFATPTSDPNAFSDGSDPKFFNYYTYSPSKAKALLAAAGYRNGFKLSMIAVQGGFGQNTDQMGDAVCKYWAQINVTCDYKVLNLNDWITAYRSGQYDANSGALGAFSTWAFYESFVAPTEAAIPNPHRWHDPVLDKLWLRGERLSGSAGDRSWRQLNDRMITQADYVPIASLYGVHYVSKRVSGVHWQAANFGKVREWVPSTG